MPNCLHLICGVALLGVVSGCAALDKVTEVVTYAKEGAVDKAAKALDGYCSAAGSSIATRKVFIDAVNAKAKANIVAFDCSGDGKPDW